MSEFPFKLNDEPLDAVLHVELLGLMLDGLIERPACRYEAHLPWTWWNDSGRAVCGVCHPPARRKGQP